MVVDERVVEALHDSAEVDVSVFVAGCAERMAQLFTGLRGGDVARESDIDIFLRTLDDLWDIDLDRPHVDFGASVASLAEFPELEPSDDELIDALDIYPFYAVLALRHAIAYAASHDVADAKGCAHVALTAMGQLDQNDNNSHFMDEEFELQIRWLPNADGMAGADLSKLRSLDRKVSRDRLSAVRNRSIRR